MKCAVVAIGVAVLVLATAQPVGAAVTATPDRTATFNGTVWASAYLGNTVYLGGDFTAAIVAGRPVPRSRLAAVNANTGALLPWAPAADARVKAIAVNGGSVYVAGDFTAIAGVRRDGLARLNAASGAVHSTFRHSIAGRPYALAVANNRLYLGGSFSAVNGQPRTRLAAFHLTSGVLDAGWRPTADDQVETIRATSGRVYLGGRFHRINNVGGSSRLAAVTPASGALDTGFRPRADVIAYSIAVGSTAVFAAHGGRGGKVVAYDLRGATRWTATFDGDPQAVALLGSTLYVGGHFDNACRSGRTGDQGTCLDGALPRVKLAALSPGTGALQSWTAHANGVAGVLTLSVSSALTKVAAGGSFTTIGRLPQKRFAQFG